MNEADRRQLAGCGVIFDMDGVLVDSFTPHFESWRIVGRTLGREVTLERFHHAFGRTSREMVEFLYGVSLSDEALRDIEQRKEAAYRDLIRPELPVMPGATEALQALRAAGASVAIGSSGPRENVALVVEAFRHPGGFDAVVTGHDVTRGKPDPQVFNLAAERMGRPPGRCLVVEDAAAGVEAAKAAAMRVVLLETPYNRTAAGQADAVIGHLRQLTPEVVAGLLRRD